MRHTEERKAVKELRSAIRTLSALDGLMLDLLARDSESSLADGFGSSSLGGGSAAKGSHSDRTAAQAVRSDRADEVHVSIVSIVEAISLIHKAAKLAESKATRLTAHARRKQAK